MRRIAALAVATLGALVLAAAASGAFGRSSAAATVLIRHQVAHCHAWSVNGGPYAADHRLALTRGGTITFINNDVMPHRLLELAGPARVTMRNGSTMPMGQSMHGTRAPGVMRGMGSTTAITLTKAGVYHFRTRAGEDYMRGFTTTGEDNVLTLTVTVA